jgi:anthranilate phosphoribosyltransferase
MSNIEVIQSALRQLAEAEPLNEQQAFDVFNVVMSGGASDAQIGALLASIQTRPGGPTVDEITGAARSMRQHATAVDVPKGLDVVDTCGTGGDHSGTFNISTAAAIVAAGAGATIAKHGNRSVTSKSGSSQVLEALGVKLDVDGDGLVRCLTEARICFCFAPAHHPAMKHAIGPRKELGFRTIFNVLGPLTNPAGAKRQVMGVYDDKLTEPIARVLKRLGAVHAIVVHGKSLAAPDRTEGGLGLDEITTTGPTRMTVLQNGSIETTDMHPADLGLRTASVGELRCEGVDQSAAIIREVLDGTEGPARDIVCLNAAAALLVADLAEDLPAGLEKARQAIDNGEAKATLDKLVELSNASEK